MANVAFDFSVRPLSAVFTTLRSLIRVCQRKHSCASKVLLPRGHPAVEAELARRQGVKATSASGLYSYIVAGAMDVALQRGVQWGSFGPPACRS